MLIISDTIFLYYGYGYGKMSKMSQQYSKIEPTMSSKYIGMIKSSSSAVGSYEILPSLSVYTYDPIGAFYFKLKEPQGKIKHAIEVDATVIVDEDESGQIVGIEILLNDKEIINKIKLN